MKKIHINQKYKWFGLITAIIKDQLINFGGEVSFHPKKGLLIHAILEEINQKYNILTDKEYISKATGYLFDKKHDELFRCQFYFNVMNQKFHSFAGSFHDIKLYPQLCLVTPKTKDIIIDHIDFQVPIWDEFLVPRINKDVQEFNELNNSIVINDYLTIELRENTTYNLVDKENIKNLFIGLNHSCPR